MAKARVGLGAVVLMAALGAACRSAPAKPASPPAAPAAAAGSLYERIGGEAAVKAVVEDLLAMGLADPKVNFTRNGLWEPTPAAVATLKQRLTDFLVQAFGGPQRYKGEDMKTAHEGFDITQAEFDALAADLLAVLEKHEVPPRERDEIMAIAASTAPDIVQKK